MSLRALHQRITRLEGQMAEAAAREDFETAARLRNEIARLRGGAGTSLVRKPPPDQIGMGSGDPVVERPRDWRPPRKPDPMTRNIKPRGRR